MSLVGRGKVINEAIEVVNDIEKTVMCINSSRLFHIPAYHSVRSESRMY